MMKRIIKRLPVVAVMIVSGWILISFILYLISGYIIYDTDHSSGASYSIPFKMEYVRNSDGDKIEMMWVPKPGADLAMDKTYLYLHGNAGRLSFVVEGLAKGGSVLSPAYPGFSGSSGRSNTEKIDEIVDLSMDFLHRKGIANDHIVVLGHSLGGSPAVYAAAEYPDLKGVILVNTFYSMKRMCEITYRGFCIFTGGIHNTAEIAPMARARIRQFHNRNDELIPCSQGEELFKLLGSEDKMLFDISGDHANFPVEDVLKTIDDGGGVSQ